MLRSEIIGSIARVTDFLADQTLDAALRSLGGDKNTAKELPNILDAVVSILGKYKTLPKSDADIIRILELIYLYDANWWTNLIVGRGSENRQGPNASAALQQLIAAKALLPRIIEMLEEGRETRTVIAVDQLANQQATSGQEVLRLVIPELSGQLSTARRVTEAVDAISEIYEAIARLQSQSVDSLTVIACDSGSNKVFDFKGLGSVMAEARTTIVELWDRIHLGGERRASAQIDVIVRSLEAFQKLEAARKAQTVSPEQAELIERALQSGATKFVRAGVLTSDISERRIANPESLVQPAPQMLLSAPGTHNVKPASSSRRKQTRTKAAPNADEGARKHDVLDEC